MTGARLGLAAALGLAVLALLGAGAVAARREIARALIVRELAARELAPAELVVDELGLGGLALSGLTAAGGDLAASRVELAWSWAGLRRGRLDRLAVDGLRLRGRVEESGASFGALGAAGPGPETAAPGAPPRFPVLPAARIELRDARLSLETGGAAFEAAVELALDPAGRGTLRVAAGALDALETALGLALEPLVLEARVALTDESLELELGPTEFSAAVAVGEGESVRVRGRSPALEIRAGPAGAETLRVRASGGEVDLPAFGFEARGISVEAEVDAETRLPAGRLEIESLRDASAAPLVRPFSFSGRFAPDGIGLGLDGTLRGAAPQLRIQLRALHDLPSGRGRAELDLDPLTLGPEKGVRPGALAPGLADALPGLEGQLEAHAELHWGDDAPGGFADLGLRDATVRAGPALLERVFAAVHVDGPWPPRIPPGQLLSMARVDFGLELTEGLVRYSVEPAGVIDLEAAEWVFAGGTVRTQGRIDLNARERALELAVADVDLDRLLTLVNLEGLTGNGRLGGTIPLRLRDDGVEIRGARLSAVEPGQLRYRPAGRSPMGGAAQALDDFVLALGNFHYRELELSLDGDAAGDVKLSLHLAGANPEHRDGQPYDFNLNLEGRLADLVSQGSRAYQIPQSIEKKLDAIARERQGGASDRLSP